MDRFVEAGGIGIVFPTRGNSQHAVFEDYGDPVDYVRTELNRLMEKTDASQV